MLAIMCEEIPTALYFDKLRPYIGCPISWERFSDDWELRRALFFYWEEVAMRHQVGWDMDHYRQLSAVTRKSDEVIRSARHNAEYWRPRAVPDYLERTKIINNYRHADDSEHRKHWSVADASEESIVASTQNGPAKYFPWLTMDELNRGLYFVMRSSWRRLVENRVSALFASYSCDLGASGGHPTRHVRFYLDYSTALVHSRPILDHEKPADEPWVTDSPADVWPDMGELSRSATIDEPVEV